MLGLDANGTKEEEPFHHFQLLAQPNCQGDVIFLTDHINRFCIAKLHNFLVNTKQKREIFFHTTYGVRIYGRGYGCS